MGRSDEEEVAELRAMFSSPTTKISRRPAWDSTPLRNRPSALRGLRPVTREPWAMDENVYNKKFEMRDIGTPDRYLDKTARFKEDNFRRVDYMCRFDQKYSNINGTLDAYALPLRHRACTPYAPPTLRNAHRPAV